MDNDDNTFQSQNCHIDGEEKTKCSLGLRSYALPKFDLDDTLQGPLRFDNLVETEVLLGIQSQENQWIEDFSRGDSREFNSSAAKSCTISRCNNVWSEATSSESVEMLLKSVRQDEMIKGHSVMESSDVSAGLDILTNQVKLNSNQGDSSLPKAGDAIVSAHNLPPEKRMQISSGTTKDTVDGLLKVDAAPQTVVENCSLPLIDRSLLIHGKCDEAIQKEENPLSDGTECKKTEDDSNKSENMRLHLASSVMQKSVANAGELDNCKVPQQVVDPFSQALCYETHDGLNGCRTDKSKENHVKNKQVQIGDPNFMKNTVESGANNVGTPSSLPVQVDSVEQMTGGSSEGIISESSVQVLKRDSVISSKDTETIDQVMGNKEEMANLMMKVDNSPVVNHNYAGNFSRPLVETDPVVQIPERQCAVESFDKQGDLPEKKQLESGTLGSTTVEEKVVRKGTGDESSNYVGNPSGSTEVCLSTEKIHESPKTDNVKVDTGGLLVHTAPEDLGSEGGSSPSMQAVSMQLHDRSSLGTGLNDIRIDNQKDSLLKKENATLFVDSSLVESETDGSISTENRLPSSCLGQNTATTAASGHEPLSVIGQESASSGCVVSEVTGLASEKKLDVVHQQLLENGSATGEVIEHMEDVKPPLFVDDLDKTDRTLTTISRESSSLVIKEIPQVVNEPIPVSAEGAICEKSGELLSVELAQCTSSMQGNALNVCEGSLSLTPASKENAQSHVLESGSNSPNVDESTCGSPTFISGCEPSRDDNKHLAGGEEYLEQNAPVSDCRDLAVDKVRSATSHHKESDVFQDDGNFTFEVNPLRDPSANVEGWKSFPKNQPSESPETVEKSPTTPSLCQMDPNMLQQVSSGSTQMSGERSEHHSCKDITEHKTQAFSGNRADSSVVSEGKSLKETNAVKHMNGKEVYLGSATPSSLGTTSSITQAKEMQPYGFSEGSSMKPSSVPIVQASNVPYTNASAFQATLLQQPFTDPQQVQLRAQILVYGSLIQGTAPDEAYMVSAFGESDGEKNAWENVWHLAVERCRNQKSPLSTPMTPVYSHIGGRFLEQGTWQSAHQTRTFCTPAARASSKGLTPPIVNPLMALSSPLWTIPTLPRDGPQCNSMSRGLHLPSHPTLSPLHPYQSPRVNHNVGNSSFWLSQVVSPGPFVGSPQTSALGGSVKYSVSPISEAVHVTSVRQSSVRHPSEMLHVSPNPWPHTEFPKSLPTGTPSPMGMKPTLLSPEKHGSADSKPKKRKKNLAFEELGKISSVHQIGKEPVSASVVPHLAITNASPASTAAKTSLGSPQLAITNTSPAGMAYKTSLGNPQLGIINTPPARTASKTSLHSPHLVSISASPVSMASKTSLGSFLPTSPLNSFKGFQTVGGRDMEQGAIFSEETCGIIEQAKLQAEDAAALAASADRHSQSVWDQLAIQKTSGLVSDVEAKLASAAVAVAAASAVARAAAAAAKVASDAALQAKLMAEEALISSSGVPDIVRNSGNTTPSSTLDGKDRSKNSNSLILSAKEVATKRVEATSASTKRAENLDAVVKAAELAAEAVSQAGTVIAMGDPIPLTLTELVEAGPAGYWKLQPLSSELLLKAKRMTGKEQGLSACEGYNRSGSHSYMQQSSGKETRQTMEKGEVPHPGNISGKVVDSNTVNNQDFSGGEKGLEKTDIDKTIGVVPESESGPRTSSVTVQDDEHGGHVVEETQKDENIKEGSLVEVQSNEEGYKGVWFPARVLNLTDDKAYVCHSVLKDKGSDHLKEWVPLEGESGKAPRIRIANSMTAIKHEGTRKRRREASGYHTWCVGDRVDALIRDGWWEGIIMEKSKDDESNFSVHFPGQGETLAVRSMNLRPSLIWKDGQWMALSSSGETKCYTHEKDTPCGKRVKKNVSELENIVEARGSNNMLKDTGNEQSQNPEHLRELALSAKEKIFNVGKSIREDKDSDADRNKQTGFQREGSRVVFGVPKPGKKTKIMEVSKQYGSNRGLKSNEVNSGKTATHQESRSHGWKNVSRVDYKGKGVTESKNKVLRQGKPQHIPSSMPEKDCSLTTVSSALNDGAFQGHLPNTKASVRHREVGSFHKAQKGSGGDTSAFGSADLPSDAPSSKRKITAAAEEDVSKGKVASSFDKQAKSRMGGLVHTHNSGKSGCDVIEPRRSNRRIQPTSRLLEGIQSSLISTKSPVVSHNKGSKAQHGTSLRGNNH